ncbi:MAG: hypothetical protein RIF37_02225 [Rhodospirillaceae bacterium]
MTHNRQDFKRAGSSRRRLVLGLGATAGLVAIPQEDARSANVVRAIEATYDMRILSTGEIYGHESWSLFVHPDGSRTLSVRLINRDYDLFRTIIHRVDAAFRPLECQLLYYRGGTRRGSAWFRIEGNRLRAEADLPTGKVTHDVEVPDEFSMVNHAAAAEGWHFWYCPKDGKEHQATLYNLRVDTTSAEGILGRVHTRSIQHLGAKETTTPAGTFACDHYAFGEPSRLWVHGPDQMPVRLRFEAADREFVLSQWVTMG